MEFAQAQESINAVVENIEKVIQGKENEIRQALTCWLAGGHVLFEDVPGTGKTMLARALAASIDAPMKRVQFTPDLLPADIVGASMYNKESGAFVFVNGPLFTSVLLADEINRATPRTQSALLEAMAERQVTAENKTYPLDDMFFVIATQNPVEQHGTFPLPEAQLDRFMMRMSLGYPAFDVEMNIVLSQLVEHPIGQITPVISREEWSTVRTLVKKVKVSETVLEYALRVVTATRQEKQLALGCSPRAGIALIHAAQAYSLMAGLDFVKPDYVKALAPAVLEHRLVLTPRARLERTTAETTLGAILKRIEVPIS